MPHDDDIYINTSAYPSKVTLFSSTMEPAARAALNQSRALVARHIRAGTFPVAYLARHLLATATTTGAKGSSPSLDERAVVAYRAAAATAAAGFRKADPPEEPRLYIVYLLGPPAKPKRADVDKSRAAKLHHRILSSALGREEAKRCMVRSYDYCHAFSA